MAKKKRVITGWIAKTDELVRWGSEWTELPSVRNEKGDDGDWPNSHWPPRKVEITIKEL